MGGTTPVSGWEYDCRIRGYDKRGRPVSSRRDRHRARTTRLAAGRRPEEGLNEGKGDGAGLRQRGALSRRRGAIWAHLVEVLKVLLVLVGQRPTTLGRLVALAPAGDHERAAGLEDADHLLDVPGKGRERDPG